jgi:adenine C2-methylase RlmN of 23S rRNA A2503 and tRNA A37
MTEQEKVRKQLEEQLERVNRRLQILDIIEEILYLMKELTQRVIDENLTDSEVMEINKEVKNLGEQVKILDGEVTKLL